MRRTFALVAVLLAGSWLSGCRSGTSCVDPPTPHVEPPPPGWAVALHGGAGTMPRDMAEDEKGRYLAALGAALDDAAARLAGGAAAVDVVEAVIRRMEDDPLFNAGRGAVYTKAGTHELDASIMTGDLRCGAVAGVKTVRHPISLARAVMEKTPHVIVAGEGADRFAVELGHEIVPNAWF
ncbi:MAG TPA: isoaspartyl peptidase/L-asparaginase, partial [Planctomycetota bacterium]|nr:isoaspartyl peptidase/L-asparaginase [Planctomycetota bacterium]